MQEKKLYRSKNTGYITSFGGEKTRGKEGNFISKCKPYMVSLSKNDKQKSVKNTN